MAQISRMTGGFNVDKGSIRLYGYGGFSGVDAVKNNIVSGKTVCVFGVDQFIGECTEAVVTQITANLLFKGVYKGQKCQMTASLSVMPKTLSIVLEAEGSSDTAPPVEAVTLIGSDFDKVWEKVYTIIS